MGHGAISRPVRRTWTLDVRPRRGEIVVTCPQCGRIPADLRSSAATRAAIVAHLAWHARADPCAGHLRTCQCGEGGCRWHARHRGCDGPILLLLTRVEAGRLWRLADTCRACATVTEHAAVVPEPLDVPSGRPATASAPGRASGYPEPPAIGWDSGHGEDGLCWVLCPWMEHHPHSGNGALPPGTRA